MDDLEGLAKALSPFLLGDVIISVERMFNHEFISIRDGTNSVCFSAECDDEENSWISYKTFTSTS